MNDVPGKMDCWTFDNSEGLINGDIKSYS